MLHRNQVSVNYFFMKNSTYTFLLLLFLSTNIWAYPIDGYDLLGIRRLLFLEMLCNGETKGKLPEKGSQKALYRIKLNLFGTAKGDSLFSLPEVDPVFQKDLEALLPNLHQSYSVAVMDISPGKKIRYAARQEDKGFQPGSVGKLAVISGLFCELQNLLPDSFEKRRELLKNRMVTAGGWAVYDHHTVPVFDMEKKKLTKRRVNEKDIFSLAEWTDHMVSVSNNGAASVVWREAILMRVFGEKYFDLTFEEAEKYFKETPKSVLAELAISVVRDPLISLGITEDEWRLGQMFTRGATAYIPGKGGSIGTPKGLMKWLVALENGEVADPASSLEIKRLLYMTDRRIRYASNDDLDDAGVYFKSGSLYKCGDNSKVACGGKYKGNIYNYMNSVAIVERGDSTVYLVALMTNVLGRNSAYDHNMLAGKIDKLIREDNTE